MSNKRIYELTPRNSYNEAINDYTIIDGENLEESLKFPISSFTYKNDLYEKVDILNESAREIVDKLNYVEDNIPSIVTGLNNNINVEFNNNNKTYSFSASSYNVISNNLEVLTITTYTNENGEVNFGLSSNTYTQKYIDEEIAKTRDLYNIEGENNIYVTRITDVNGEGTNKFIVSLDGITAVTDNDDYENVKDYGVIINDNNSAFNFAMSQGINNYASGNAFTQGNSNIASSYSLSQGSNNIAINLSLSQGSNNYAKDVSLAQGGECSAINVSFTQGLENYAENYSMSLGYESIAKDCSFVFGGMYGGAEAYEHSISLGENAYASSYSYNFFGDKVYDYSMSVGHNGVVSSHTTALGNYNEPRFVSGDNPYTFALGDGTRNEPHTFFRVDRSGVYFSTGANHEINLAKLGEKNTIICNSFAEYETLKKIEGNEHKVFIIG